MSHLPLLRRAANPAPFKVLGLALKPFSLGHALLTAGQEAEPELPLQAALPAAVWLCANSWAENRSLRLSPLTNLKLNLWRLRRRFVRYDYLAQAAAFRRYVLEGSLEFPTSEISDSTLPTGGRPPGAAFLLLLHDFLLERDYVRTDTQAWDHPFGYAKMRWQTYWEDQGTLRIRNWEEESFDRQVKEREKKGDPCPAS